MRKLFPLLLATLIVVCFSACGGGNKEQISKKTDITLKVNGLQPGWMKLIGTIGSQNFLVDTLLADANGVIHLKRDSVLPGGFYWVGLPGDTYIQMILDKDQEFSMATDVFGINAQMKVEGSLDNELLYDNLRFEDQFRIRYDSLTAALNSKTKGTPEYKDVEDRQKAMIEQRRNHIKHFEDQYPNSFFTIYKLAGQNPELKEVYLADGVTLDEQKQVYLYRNEFWDNVDFADERLLRTPVLNNKLTRYLNELVDRQPDSLVKYCDWLITKSEANREVFKFFANQIAIKYEKSDVMGGHAVFVHVIDKFFTDQKAFWSNAEELGKIRKLANEMRPSLIGKVAQDITCFNTSGQKESLYDLKSKLIVLYMYSYSCEHCQERTPDMVKVYNEYKNKGLDVYALCVDVEDAPWRKFIQDYGTTAWHNVIDPKFESEFYKKYHVDITPEVYVIRNSDKVIIAKDLHPNQLPDLLDRELPKL
ncbi:MAG: redoxin domain-containing protein [Bacteroidia bacterium]|nr:redoxin domain-containing protein [Bacteroidia bacterium]